MMGDGNIKQSGPGPGTSVSNTNPRMGLIPITRIRPLHPKSNGYVFSQPTFKAASSLMPRTSSPSYVHQPTTSYRAYRHPPAHRSAGAAERHFAVRSVNYLSTKQKNAHKWVRPAPAGHVSPQQSRLSLVSTKVISNVVQASESGNNASKVAGTTTDTSNPNGPLKPIVELRMDNRKGLRLKRRSLLSSSPAKQNGTPIKMFRKSEFKKSSFPTFPRYSPRTNGVFKIKKYSIVRVRKSSMSTLLQANGRNGTVKPFTTPRKPRSHRISASYFTFSQSTPPKSAVRLAAKAVQRSRHLLSSSKRKKNTFCIFFNRIGVCSRRNNGCPYIHDPRQIHICTLLIKNGKCGKENCTLSHDFSVGKVPSCRFFREGTCSNVSCPFRHSLSPMKKRKIKKKLQDDVKESQDQQPTNDKDSINSLGIELDYESELAQRYFNTDPDPQPTVHVIQRRLPKDLIASVPIAEKENESSDDEVKIIGEIKGNKYVEVGKSGEIDVEKSTSRDISGEDIRRQRILDKVTQIKTIKNQEKQPSGSSMPTFVKFT